MSRPVVYLIHFAQPIGNPASPRGQAGHYLGTAQDLGRRLAQHRTGTGAAIMRAVVEQGVPFFVARTWPGGRRLERQLKRQHNSRGSARPACRRPGSGPSLRSTSWSRPPTRPPSWSWSGSSKTGTTTGRWRREPDPEPA